ncbi:MAG TPA: 2-oxo acid dehydrogenase subunit E2 [Streptosporangiaceae bacterium]
MPEFTMPSLGADMDEGKVQEWLVKPGDQVHRGDIVAVVETAKAAIEVECFANGVIETLLAEPGQVVPVGGPLAVIAPVGAFVESPPEVTHLPESPAASRAAEPSPPGAAVVMAPPPPAPLPRVSSPLVRHLAEEMGVDLASVRGTGRAKAITRADVEEAARRGTRPRVSPLARRLAAELGVDLRDVAGTGAHGTIRAEDVRHTVQATAAPGAAVRPEPAASPRAVPSAEPTEPSAAVPSESAAPPTAARGERATDRQAAMRRAIGRLMARSKREIPHYYLSTTIDMAPAMTWLHALNRQLPVSGRLVPAALLLKATALAARDVPELNGFWVDDGFVPGPAVHLGIAISLRGGGLVTPALHDAADLELSELMARMRDLVGRARAGRLRGSELTDATITVTNLGDQGIESVTGVIFPPQVALVGFGKVVERPWAVGGLLGVRPVVTVTVSADHRATDGYTGGRFLDMISRLLQEPEDL